MSQRLADEQQTGPRKVRPSNKATAAVQAKREEQRKQLFRWLGAGLLLAFVAAAALYFLTKSEDDGTTVVGGPANAATVVPGPSFPSSLAVNGTTLGDADAPILVVEYGDYQCPFCTKFARQSMSKLVDDYIMSGKIRFEFHDYPIIGSSADGTMDQNGESFRAAEAVLCANDQNQYWPYHNILYANSVGEFKDSFTPDRLKTLGGMVPGMDTTAFNACVDARTHTADVQALGSEAIADGVTSTPTFKVNGQPVTGADYNNLTKVIDEQI